MDLPTYLPTHKASAAAQAGAGTVLAVGAFVMPPLAVLSPLGLAPLFGIMALAILAADGRRCWQALRPMFPFTLLLAALALWSVASALWSIAPAHSLQEGLRLLAIGAGGLVIVAAATALRPRERTWLGDALVGGTVLALILLLVERTSDGALTRLVLDPGLGVSVPIQRFDRGATALVLALWPALTVLVNRRRKAAAIALPALVAAMVLVLASHAAILAVFAGLLAFGIALLLPRVVAILLALVLVAATVAMPLTVPDFDRSIALHRQIPAINPSALHRLLIWRFVAERIAERPVLGWGMDAARDLPGGQLNLAKALPEARLPDNAVALPLHPHNAALQWRLELGIPGTILALAILIWPLWHVGWRIAPRQSRAAMLAWAASAIIIGFVSYGFWQAWWLACLWLGAAFLAAPAEERVQVGDG